MRNEPRFSIVIPCLDRVDLLEYTLASVREQSLPDWECRVVDDGSSPENLDRIRSLTRQDSRFSLIQRTGGKRGASSSRNLGWRSAKSENIIFLDSDDALHRRCLELRSEALQGFPGHDYLVFTSQEFRHKIGDRKNVHNLWTSENVLSRFLKLDIVWLTPCVLWKRQTLEVLGGWDENLLSWQDWDLHVRAVLSGASFKFFDRVDSYFRLPDRGLGSIGLQSRNGDHLKSHEYLLDKLRQTLASDEGADHLEHLSYICFWLCLQWVRLGLPAEAQRIWKKTEDDVSEDQFTRVSSYLEKLNSPVLRPILLAAHRLAYNPGYRLWHSSTYRSRSAAV
jgi:glycosyltransferase involved in cell wall biosynthesis